MSKSTIDSLDGIGFLLALYPAIGGDEPVRVSTSRSQSAQGEIGELDP
ncbi:MAG: hypothetical protein OXN90_11025 [Gemmatimonadota bacterium]|nr:hypothetical protein [Gemmatimonadota bacterium]